MRWPSSCLQPDTARDLRLPGLGRRARARWRAAVLAHPRPLPRRRPAAGAAGRLLCACLAAGPARPAARPRPTGALPCIALRAALSALDCFSDAPLRRPPGGQLLRHGGELGQGDERARRGLRRRPDGHVREGAPAIASFNATGWCAWSAASILYMSTRPALTPFLRQPGGDGLAARRHIHRRHDHWCACLVKLRPRTAMPASLGRPCLRPSPCCHADL